MPAVIFAPTLLPSIALPPQPVTLRWTSMTGATTYSLWVCRVEESGAETVAISVTELNATSFTPTAPLIPGTYRVWLRAIGANGLVSSWSAPIDITI